MFLISLYRLQLICGALLFHPEGQSLLFLACQSTTECFQIVFIWKYFNLSSLLNNSLGGHIENLFSFGTMNMASHYFLSSMISDKSAVKYIEHPLCMNFFSFAASDFLFVKSFVSLTIFLYGDLFTFLEIVELLRYTF